MIVIAQQHTSNIILASLRLTKVVLEDQSDEDERLGDGEGAACQKMWTSRNSSNTQQTTGGEKKDSNYNNNSSVQNRWSFHFNSKLVIES